MNLSNDRKVAEEAEAQRYADLYRRVGPGDRAAWLEANANIVERWSISALNRIKTRAWQILENR